MSIKKLLRNSIHAIKFRGTSAEKFSTFLTLSRLQIKRSLSNKKNSKVNEHFLNYKFWGFDYRAIEDLFNEIFMLNEYYFETSNPEPLIIDCGANIGMSILYFKKLFPKSKIIAFEANPHAFGVLEENIKENKIDNVEIHNIALFDKEEEISFYIGENIGTVMGSLRKGRSGYTEMIVKAKKLSDYLNGYETIDLIKMDVEGAEIDILADLIRSSTLNKAKEYIIEYHHNMNDDKSSLSSFLEKFESNGFNYNIKSTFEKINHFQDILIHFYKLPLEQSK